MTVVEFRSDGRRKPSGPVVKPAAAIQWALLGLLANEQWWEFHDLFSRVEWIIPAGSALAQREAHRVREWQRQFERSGRPVPPGPPPPRKSPSEPSVELYKARLTIYRQRLADLRACGYMTYHPERGRQCIRITEKGMALYSAYEERRQTG